MRNRQALSEIVVYSGQALTLLKRVKNLAETHPCLSRRVQDDLPEIILQLENWRGEADREREGLGHIDGSE